MKEEKTEGLGSNGEQEAWKNEATAAIPQVDWVGALVIGQVFRRRQGTEFEARRPPSLFGLRVERKPKQTRDRLKWEK